MRSAVRSTIPALLPLLLLAACADEPDQPLEEASCAGGRCDGWFSRFFGDEPEDGPADPSSSCGPCQSLYDACRAAFDDAPERRRECVEDFVECRESRSIDPATCRVDPPGCWECRRDLYRCASDATVADFTTCEAGFETCRQGLEFADECVSPATEPREEACSGCQLTYAFCARYPLAEDAAVCAAGFELCTERVRPAMDAACRFPPTCEECQAGWQACRRDVARSIGECAREMDSCLTDGVWTNLECPEPEYLCEECQSTARLCLEAGIGLYCGANFDMCVHHYEIAATCPMPASR